MYRSACNLAMKSNMNGIAHELNQLHRNKHIKKFWNLIRKTNGRAHPTRRLQDLKSILKISFQIHVIKVRWSLSLSEKFKINMRLMVKYYIAKLNSGSAPGIDGVMTEHFKYATESSIVNRLSSMLTLCLKFGIVPKSFSSGLLVPLKTNT